MNTKEAAAKLETTPRALRRFLRADDHFNNAGAGGTYAFTDTEFLTLRKRFNAWRVTNRVSRATDAPAARRLTSDEKDPTTMPVSILGRRLTSAERAERDRRSRERVDRLEAQLKASGNHISQLKDRQWA